MVSLSISVFALPGACHGREVENLVRPECQVQNWFWNFLKEPTNSGRQEILRQTLDQCSAEFTQGQLRGNDARQALAKLPSSQGWEPFAEQALSGRALNGWWRIIRDGKSHPAVVLNCAFNCDPRSDSYLKMATRALGEEASFHLVVIKSETSQSLNTGRWLFGALEEANTLLEGGLWLQVAAKVRTKISSVHLLGFGWAGHSTLFAALYNDKNPAASDRKVFQSAVAFCPLIRAQSAGDALLFDHLDNLRRNFARWVPWVDLSQADGGWLQATMEQVKLDPPIWRKPFLGNPPKSREDWLYTTDFVYQSVGLQTPVQVLGQSLDSQFPATDLFALAQQHQDPSKSLVRVNPMGGDSSCALTAEFGEDVGGALLRAEMLLESYDIWPRTNFHQEPWTPPAMTSEELVRDVRWVEENHELMVKWTFGRKQGSSRIELQVVDLKSLKHLSESLPSQPKSIDLDQEVRWLNAHSRWLDTEGQNVLDKPNPGFIEWAEF